MMGLMFCCGAVSILFALAIPLVGLPLEVPTVYDFLCALVGKKGNRIFVL